MKNKQMFYHLGIVCFALILICGTAFAAIDKKIIGVWGVDKRGGYDFRANGTVILSGVSKYNYTAANGIWSYWQASMPKLKVTAEYKISPDGKEMSLNLKKGNPFNKVKRIK